MKAAKWKSRPPMEAANLALPGFDLPPGSCDCHMHVFGSDRVHPSCKSARYTNPQATVEKYDRVMTRLGIERLVLVQPSYYGSDNRVLLDRLSFFGGRALGVIIYDRTTDERTLRRLASAGVRSLRLDLFNLLATGSNLQDIRAELHHAAATAARVDIGLDLYAPGVLLDQMARELADLQVPVTIAHMGLFRPEYFASRAATLRQFTAFVETISRGNCWMKLTGAYRIDRRDPSLPRLMARHILEVMPDRALWGSDWPHVMTEFQDTGQTLEVLGEWCPDPAMRQRLLADNPSKLYDPIARTAQESEE